MTESVYGGEWCQCHTGRQRFKRFEMRLGFGTCPLMTSNYYNDTYIRSEKF